MILVTNSGKAWIAGLIVSLGIFAVIYFTVIKPSTDEANNVAQHAFQQANQQLKQAAQGTHGAARKQLSQAQLLTQCLSQAGTDVSAVSDCNDKYGP